MIITSYFLCYVTVGIFGHLGIKAFSALAILLIAVFVPLIIVNASIFPLSFNPALSVNLSISIFSVNFYLKIGLEFPLSYDYFYFELRTPPSSI
jgi:hypothetical protein